eukprot:COSAG06_NODE_2447_length_6864_cov_3.888101_6_plen_149_part_00
MIIMRPACTHRVVAEGEDEDEEVEEEADEDEEAAADQEEEDFAEAFEEAEEGAADLLPVGSSSSSSSSRSRRLSCLRVTSGSPRRRLVSRGRVARGRLRQRRQSLPLDLATARWGDASSSRRISCRLMSTLTRISSTMICRSVRLLAD